MGGGGTHSVAASFGTLGTEHVSKSLVPDSTPEPPQPASVNPPITSKAARHTLNLVNIEFSRLGSLFSVNTVLLHKLRISFFIIDMSSLRSTAYRNIESFLFALLMRSNF